MNVYVKLNGGGAVDTVYGGPQPQDSSVVEIADSDARYVAWLAAGTVQAAYAAAIQAGLAITSSGSPAISGTYGIATTDLLAMTAMQLAVEAGKPLPAAYWDSKGNHGAFTAPQVTNIADAIFNYEALLVAWVSGGGVGTQPAASATIA